ncbi:MAG: hypothetical protein QXT63_02170 [Thermoplasmata archaeon]
MSKGKLSKNEKLTLYGLVKYPDYNDREIAEKIGLKMSTVTAIKNRLKKNNVFSTIRVPLLQNLGCEMLEVGYAKNYSRILQKLSLLYSSLARCSLCPLLRILLNRKKTSTDSSRYSQNIILLKEIAILLFIFHSK